MDVEAPLVMTVSVWRSGDTSVHTRAENLAEDEVRPMLDLAVSALTAEREALERCPYHRGLDDA